MNHNASAAGAPSGPPHRVLRMITRLNVGGPALHALLLTRGLAPEYQTTLVAGTPEASEGELGDTLVKVNRVALVRPPNPKADAQALAAVRRLMTRHRPALLHTHMAKAGAVGRVATIGMTHRPRVVHTFHGHVLEGYFGPVAQRVIINTERLLARRCDAIVTVSPEIRDELLDLGIGRRSQFHVIPLGLKLDPLLTIDRPSGTLRAHIGVPPDVPLVGIVGRLVPIKDHETFLVAMSQLSGVHVAILGDGELRHRLETRARSLGLADRTHFTGWWTDMASAVADLDVVVLTSRNEGTPLALIEAGAAARPVVASDVGGVRSVVVDGVTGFVVAPGDPDAVATQVGRLVGNQDLRRDMGRAGREHVRHRFGETRLLDDMRALYAELLTRSGSRRDRQPSAGPELADKGEVTTALRSPRASEI